MKIATPLSRKATKCASKSRSRKESQSHKRSSYDTFSEPDPFTKGRKFAKTPSKGPPSPKIPRAHASLPVHSPCGLPEDEVDYGSTTGEESDFSIDVNLEDSVARDRTLLPGSFSARSLSSADPGFTSVVASGSKENQNLKGKATKRDDRLSSPIAPSSGQNKVISYASVAATPKPVSRSQVPNPVPKTEPKPDEFPPLDPVILKASANKSTTQRVTRENILIERNKVISYSSATATPLPVRRLQEPNSKPKPEPKQDRYPSLFLVVPRVSANKKDSTKCSMREDVLIK